MRFLQHVMERWETERPSDMAALTAFSRGIETACGPTTNLYIYDLRPDSPLLFGVNTVTENVDMKSRMATTVGSYPDQDYIHADVIPHYMGVKLSGAPSLRRMTSRIQGHVAVYDRLILPLRSDGAASWALSLTRTLALIPPAPGTAGLTDRQEETLQLLTRGLSSKETATRMGISPRTVDHLAETARRKLGARNTAHAVAIYVGHTFAQEDP